ncbi:MAG: hypothetical protein NTW86_20285 [Candidatus Sumerlaeota bacterium]|nr:hypothetical protein [Candidatus Sumerlaeota bacterium]
MEKEFLSSFTFGFLMAQLFPGALTLFALSAPILALGIAPNASLADLACAVCDKWFTTPTRVVLFLFLAVGIGMFIHGIHWMILAWLENRADSPRPVRQLWFHRMPFWTQLLLAPAWMVVEILWLLVAVRGLDKLTMEENVSELPPERFEAFEFLQEFYLYFGQFYAHTAYALLISIPCVLASLGRVRPGECAWAAALLYFAAAVFHLMGRVQLASLFKAERKLLDHAAREPR